MARINAKPPLFAVRPAELELERLSKAALVDVVIDCCKGMFAEDVFADRPASCLADAGPRPGDRCRTLTRPVGYPRRGIGQYTRTPAPHRLPPLLSP